MIASVVRLLALVQCAVCVVLLASTASAGNVVEPPEYRGFIGDALDEFEAGNFAEARSLFARAHGLCPSARTLRGLGLSSFELREYQSAIDYLERALASDQNPIEGTLRDATEQVLSRARGFVGHFALRLEPSYAQLRVDGIPHDAGPVLALEVGSHVLDIEAPGYRAERRVVRVLGGEDEEIAIALGASARALASATDVLNTPPPHGMTRAEDGGRTHEERESAQPLYRSGWLWVGIGMVAVAVGVALGVAGRSAKTSVGEVTLTRNTPNGAVLSALGEQR